MTHSESVGQPDGPHISVVVLNWNNWKDTLECLESVFQVAYNRFSLILVDNGSTDDSVQKFRDYCEGKIQSRSPFFSYSATDKPLQLVEMNENDAVDNREIPVPKIPNRSVILITCKKNHGYARGNNIGIRAALKIFDPAYILILNNDIVVNDPSMFSVLIAEAGRERAIGVVSPVLHGRGGEIQRACTRNFPTFFDYLFVYSFLGQRVFRNNRFWNRHFNADYAFDKPRDIDVLGGSCMLFRSHALRDIGLFDEATFLYWEEFIIGKKLQSAGLRSVLIPQVSVIHKGEITINTMNLKSWARYWSVQSELYYVDQYTRTPLLQRSIIIVTLLIEAVIALGASSLSREREKFNTGCEKKTIWFLMHSLIPVR